MKPKVIIYDFDGVICDSVHVKTKAFAELYSQYGDDIQSKVVRYHLDHGGISRFEKIRYYETQLLNQIVTEEKVQELGRQFADLVKNKVISCEYVPGALEFVRLHSADCIQYVCTGTPEFEILEIVEKRGLTAYFCGIYGSPESKTNIIKRILNETRCNADECVFLGDAMTDYKAAVETGIPFIGVLSDETAFPEGITTIKDFTDSKIPMFTV